MSSLTNLMISEKAQLAAKNILCKSMTCDVTPYKDSPICILFDDESGLSKLIFQSFAHAAAELDSDLILIKVGGDMSDEDIVVKLKELPKHSTCVVVQSTNFRLSKFRLRLELFNRGIGVAEFVHLGYIPENQYETFVNSLEHRQDEYLRKSKELISKFENSNELEIINTDGSSCVFSGGFEEAKGNTGDYTGRVNRGGMYPVGEVFTECLDLSNVNGTLFIDQYIDDDMQVVVCEPFAVKIENGLVIPGNYPDGFNRIVEKISAAEGDVQIREIGLGLNPAISRVNNLSDISCHERLEGLHLSLGKKHAIYRKKYDTCVVQRYHIDVFPFVDCIKLGEEVIYREEKYLI